MPIEIKIQLADWPEHQWVMRVRERTLMHKDVRWILEKFLHAYRQWFSRGRIEYLSTEVGYRLELDCSV